MISTLTVFVFVGLFTPGPNVIMLTASGARFGFQATLPHLFGVVLGVGLIAAATSFGLGAFLMSNPNLKLVFQVISTLWIGWIAWKLFQATAHSQTARDRPFTFFEAMLFQVVNPKIWAIAIAASTSFASSEQILGAGILAANFSGVNLFVCAFWTMFGTMLAKLLSSPRAWAIFRKIMAVLLVASCGLIWT